MAMRSMWMVFLIVMIPFQVAGWIQNRDAMDLAIGIRYHATSHNDKQPPVVIHIIKWLANNLALGKSKASMAIVDFRDSVNVLLTLNDGVDATKVKEACDNIGQGSYQNVNTMSMSEVAEETRKKIDWSTDPLRSHLPQVVLVFWEVGDDFNGNEAKYPHNVPKREKLMAKALEAKHVGAGFVFLNHFDGSGWPNDGNYWTDIWVVFPALGSDGPASSHTKPYWSSRIASRSVDAIRKFMGMCRYTWNPQHDCYMHNVHGCVQNIVIDLKFDNGTHTAPVWDDLLPFCFKTATIYPCAGTCPKTTTSTTATTMRKSVSTEKQPTTTKEEPASRNIVEEVDDDDSSKVALGVGVTCALVIPTAVAAAVFLVVKKCKKKKGAGGDKSMKASPTQKSVAFLSRSQSMGPSERSYAKPTQLSVSQTPPSLLVKQSMKSMKSRK